MNTKTVDINTIIDEVTAAFVGQFDQNELLNRILLLSKELFNAEVCAIFLRKEDNLEIIECVAGSGYGEELAKVRKSYNLIKERNGMDKKSFTGHIVEKGECYNIKSRQQMEELAAAGLPWAKKHNAAIWGRHEDGTPKDDMKNIMAAPLKIGEQIIGVIKIENKKDANEFSEEDFLSFKIISKMISLALENAKLHYQAEKQRKNVHNIFSTIANDIVGSFAQKNFFTSILESIKDTFHAEAASLYLIENNKLMCVAGKGFASNIVGKFYNLADTDDLKSLTVAVYQGRRTIKIDSKDALDAYRKEGKWQGKFDNEQWGKQDGFRNLLAIPLVIKDECLGIVKLENKEPMFGNNFSTEDQFNVEAIANFISLTIKNFKLQEENSKNLRLISAKAAHRIINQILRYDYIEIQLEELQEKIMNCNVSNECKNVNVQELIETTGITTRNLKKMVKQFSQFARPLELKKADANINKMVQDAAKFAAGNEKQIKIHEDLSVKIPMLAMDSRFSEAIQELIKNAIQAIKEDTKNPEKAPEIWLKTEMSHEKIILTVRDNGPGLPNFNNDKNIFDPFVTLSTQGTGLGLATVKELVEAHGGSIMARDDKKSGKTVGSIFEINLPIYTEDK